MKSGVVHEFYMSQKFGSEWRESLQGNKTVSSPAGPKTAPLAGGSEPPARPRVWRRSPEKSSTSRVRASNSVPVGSGIDSGGDIVGEPVTPDLPQVASPARRAVTRSVQAAATAPATSGLSPGSLAKLGQARLMSWVREHLPETEAEIPDLLKDPQVGGDPNKLLGYLKQYVQEELAQHLDPLPSEEGDEKELGAVPQEPSRDLPATRAELKKEESATRDVPPVEGPVGGGGEKKDPFEVLDPWDQSNRPTRRELFPTSAGAKSRKPSGYGRGQPLDHGKADKGGSAAPGPTPGIPPPPPINSEWHQRVIGERANQDQANKGQSRRVVEFDLSPVAIDTEEEEGEEFGDRGEWGSPAYQVAEMTKANTMLSEKLTELFDKLAGKEGKADDSSFIVKGSKSPLKFNVTPKLPYFDNSVNVNYTILDFIKELVRLRGLTAPPVDPEHMCELTRSFVGGAVRLEANDFLDKVCTPSHEPDPEERWERFKVHLTKSFVGPEITGMHETRAAWDDVVMKPGERFTDFMPRARLAIRRMEDAGGTRSQTDLYCDFLKKVPWECTEWILLQEATHPDLPKNVDTFSDDAKKWFSARAVKAICDKAKGVVGAVAAVAEEDQEEVDLAYDARGGRSVHLPSQRKLTQFPPGSFPRGGGGTARTFGAGAKCADCKSPKADHGPGCPNNKSRKDGRFQELWDSAQKQGRTCYMCLGGGHYASDHTEEEQTTFKRDNPRPAKGAGKGGRPYQPARQGGARMTRPVYQCYECDVTMVSEEMLSRHCARLHQGGDWSTIPDGFYDPPCCVAPVEPESIPEFTDIAVEAMGNSGPARVREEPKEETANVCVVSKHVSIPCGEWDDKDFCYPVEEVPEDEWDQLSTPPEEAMIVGLTSSEDEFDTMDPRRVRFEDWMEVATEDPPAPGENGKFHWILGDEPRLVVGDTGASSSTIPHEIVVAELRKQKNSTHAVHKNKSSGGYTIRRVVKYTKEVSMTGWQDVRSRVSYGCICTGDLVDMNKGSRTQLVCSYISSPRVKEQLPI